jgi:hypothetical protein
MSEDTGGRRGTIVEIGRSTLFKYFLKFTPSFITAQNGEKEKLRGRQRKSRPERIKD